MSAMFASSVAGRPMRELVKELCRSGVDAELVSCFTDEAWWNRRIAGIGALASMLRPYFGFPVQVLLAGIRRRPTHVVLSSNPISLAVLVWPFVRILRLRVTVLVYDLPHLIVEGARGRSPVSSGLAYLAGILLRRACLAADGAVFVSKEMKDLLLGAATHDSRFVVIETGSTLPVGAVAGAGDKALPLLDDLSEHGVLVSYVGNLGLVHDWRTLSGGMRRAALSHEGNWVQVLVASTGRSVMELRRTWVDLERTGTVRFLGSLPVPEWQEVMRRTDVALVSVTPLGSRVSFPSKIYDCMAHGSAILAVAPPGSGLARLVEGSRCGLVVAPGDTKGFAACLNRLVTDRALRLKMGAAGIEAIATKYSFEKLAGRWREEVIGA